MKKNKKPRFPDFELITEKDGTPTSHLLDSLWIKKDSTELKIVFATGKILEFKPLETLFPLPLK